MNLREIIQWIFFSWCAGLSNCADSLINKVVLGLWEEIHTGIVLFTFYWECKPDREKLYITRSFMKGMYEQVGLYVHPNAEKTMCVFRQRNV
jgi:hypothetical protein